MQKLAFKQKRILWNWAAFTHLLLHASLQAMQANGLDENSPHTIGDAANAYAAATLAGISRCSNDWDALDSAAFRSCTPEPGMLSHVAQLLSCSCVLHDPKSDPSSFSQ